MRFGDTGRFLALLVCLVVLAGFGVLVALAVLTATGSPIAAVLAYAGLLTAGASGAGAAARRQERRQR